MGLFKSNWYVADQTDGGTVQANMVLHCGLKLTSYVFQDVMKTILELVDFGPDHRKWNVHYGFIASEVGASS